MRLIDADQYKGKVICNHTYSGVKKLINIDDVPTAYDIDKVVEDIRCRCYEMGLDESQTEIIVKSSRALVADDVCEWKITDEPQIVCKTTCGKYIKGDYFSDTCPYCGKKIKVVE